MNQPVTVKIPLPDTKAVRADFGESLDVALETTCSTCNRTGHVYREEWKRFNEAATAWWARHPEMHECCPDIHQEIKYKADGDPFPETPEGQEEMPCPDCEGLGLRPTEAGMNVLAFLWHYLKVPVHL